MKRERSPDFFNSPRENKKHFVLEFATIIELIHNLIQTIFISTEPDAKIKIYNSLLNDLKMQNADKSFPHLLVENTNPLTQARSLEVLENMLLLQAEKNPYGSDVHPIALNFTSPNDAGMTPLECAFSAKNLKALEAFGDYNDTTCRFNPEDFSERRRHAGLFDNPMVNSRGESVVDLVLDLLQKLTEDELAELKDSETLPNLFIHLPTITEHAHAFDLSLLSMDALQLLQRCFTSSEKEIIINDDETAAAIDEYSDFADKIQAMIAEKVAAESASPGT